MRQAVLWYFADPMCSWCWGFSPVINAIKQDYESKLKFALTMGGLRSNETQALSKTQREEILQHWREVHKLTGQTFNFDKPMPDGFIYNTEPASRAVISMALKSPALTMSYLQHIQSAFYRENKDVTQSEVLIDIARLVGLEDPDFEAIFNSSELKQKTQLHFQRTREFGVRGFPTVILQTDNTSHVMSRGYKAYESLKAEIDRQLEN